MTSTEGNGLSCLVRAHGKSVIPVKWTMGSRSVRRLPSVHPAHASARAARRAGAAARRSLVGVCERARLRRARSRSLRAAHPVSPRVSRAHAGAAPVVCAHPLWRRHRGPRRDGKWQDACVHPPDHAHDAGGDRRRERPGSPTVGVQSEAGAAPAAEPRAVQASARHDRENRALGRDQRLLSHGARRRCRRRYPDRHPDHRDPLVARARPGSAAPSQT